MRTTALCASVCLIALQCSIAQTTDSDQSRNRQPAEGVTAVSQSLVSPSSDYVPLTQEERLHYYFKSTFGAEGLLRSLAGAGISQWQNTPSEWGQGGEGYGKRVANSYAQHVMRGTLMYGLSSVLHEDNRYIQSTETAFGPRLKYAITSSFLARKDDGTRHVSISRFSSYLATAFISREWQPRSNSDASSAMMSFGTAMGTTVGFNVAREFLPKIFNRHRD